VASLNDEQYNRLARNAQNALVVFMNKFGESYTTGKLITLRKTRNRVKTRWETSESHNVSPFTYISLVVKGELSPQIIEIKPIPSTQYGFVDLEFDYEGTI
jgi:hypothetical protein